MEFKSNFNQLHYLLTERFDNIIVEEKSNPQLGNYIQLSIKENLECKVLIKKKDLENNKFNWSYLANPLNEKSGVERISTVETITKDIEDIITNKRFDSDYINNLK
jgi:hypothetical protein